MELMIPTTDDLSVAIKALLDEVAESLEKMSDYGVYRVKVEEVPHEAFDGFVPWTNGGYTGTASVSFRDGKEHWKAIEEYAKRDEADKMSEFRDEIRRDGDTTMDEANIAVLTDDELIEKFGDKFEEFEQEWDDGDDDVFFLKFRAVYYAKDNYRNKSGEDEIYFFAGVNTDFNYGRDSISWMPGSTYESEWEMNVPVSECSPEKIAEIKAAMIEYFRKA